MEQVWEDLNVVGGFEATEAALVEEKLVLGSFAVPRNEIQWQTKELFKGIEFRVLDNPMEKVVRMDST